MNSCWNVPCPNSVVTTSPGVMEKSPLPMRTTPAAATTAASSTTTREARTFIRNEYPPAVRTAFTERAVPACRAFRAASAVSVVSVVAFTAGTSSCVVRGG